MLKVATDGHSLWARICARFPAYVRADMLNANDAVALQIVLAEKEEYG